MLNPQAQKIASHMRLALGEKKCFRNKKNMLTRQAQKGGRTGGCQVCVCVCIHMIMYTHVYAYTNIHQRERERQTIHTHTHTYTEANDLEHEIRSLESEAQEKGQRATVYNHTQTHTQTYIHTIIYIYIYIYIYI